MSLGLDRKPHVEMAFRIAIGRCDCQPPYRNPVEEAVCESILESLAACRSRLPEEATTIPHEHHEERIVGGRHVTFGTYKLQVGECGTLIVFQALVHTWSRPTFLSIRAIGRMYAEGLLFTKEDNVEPASDALLWQFR